MFINKLGTFDFWRINLHFCIFCPSQSVHAQATASPRALMSLSTVLASMFPPKDTAMEWNSEFNWQPIPILSEPLEQDSVSTHAI